ncbi:ATPase family associated with various cellular activities (AAA) [Lachnospiraceae bacterium NE2001]|nr:ATPase family associated with various cellular activities (AAA) [Lachnospiraceae bacterium NE2001]
MRYLEFAFGSSTEEIKKNAKINLRDYYYDNPVHSLNNYMYKTLQNGYTFFCYREEEGVIYAAMSFDEQRSTFIDAFMCVLGHLRDTFLITTITLDPEEITMTDFYDDLMEARRRDLMQYSTKIVDISHLWIYDYYNMDKDKDRINCEFKEKIIGNSVSKKCAIYDSHFIEELENIDAHQNIDGFTGNIVHYVLSVRSQDAATDMIEILMQHLLESNRISSRRMGIISDIDPDAYRRNNHFEDIIENNNGGVVVFDLSERFGKSPTQYLMLCKYLEKLLKKYKDKCLFVFTYNMDHPGFSYYLLPELENYVLPVMLREGSGDRRSAVQYMKELIKNSEYADYAKYANEYMKLYPGNTFNQSDVIAAYEKFPAWCLRNYILKSYNIADSDEFMLDRDDDTASSYEKLHNLIGLDLVKKKIDTIIATDIVEKERKRRRGNDYEPGSMHMIFGGDPGTAKTTVAKAFAGIAKEKGILKSGRFVVRGGMDLTGMLCVDLIRDAFVAAKGGVLFIDEAYSMKGDIAISTLIQEMENHRDSVIVILAGYSERMKEFLKQNEGLESRIPYWIDFPNYTTEELTEIFKLMIKDRGFTVSDDAIKEASYIFDRVRIMDNFGNGRYVRNLLDKVAENQSVRILGDKTSAEKIKKKDLFHITKEDISSMDEGLVDERPRGTAKKELDEMIGLDSVKKLVNKALAKYRMNKILMDKGFKKDKPSMHLVFTGNPGTAKTTVARLFAEILKDEQILSSGNCVEVGRADLIGAAVGHTAMMVTQRFKEAKGGVLFIDEAYSLCDKYDGYGDEAISTIVQEMENHRDDVIVIFAGYPEPMKEFLDRNPGMMSRVAFHMNFEDYSVDELLDITRLMVERKQYTITDAALKKLRGIYESVVGTEDYGNGRFVRKILEEAEMNLAERLLDVADDDLTTELLTTIEECDIPIPEPVNEPAKVTFGFTC